LTVANGGERTDDGTAGRPRRRDQRSRDERERDRERWDPPQLHARQHTPRRLLGVAAATLAVVTAMHSATAVAHLLLARLELGERDLAVAVCVELLEALDHHLLVR